MGLYIYTVISRNAIRSLALVSPINLNVFLAPGENLNKLSRNKHSDSNWDSNRAASCCEAAAANHSLTVSCKPVIIAVTRLFQRSEGKSQLLNNEGTYVMFTSSSINRMFLTHVKRLEGGGASCKHTGSSTFPVVAHLLLLKAFSV